MLNFIIQKVDTVWTLGMIKFRPCFFPMHANKAVYSGCKMNVQNI